jgi:cobalt-zinc-cadmium efflux system outer membrane protein
LLIASELFAFSQATQPLDSTAGMQQMDHDHSLAKPAPFALSIPDLLKDVAARPQMNLRDFEQMAVNANPTLRAANALTEQSAASAHQAGLYPNPSVGYQGEQIRGGSFHGGEQGAFVQQTFVLGGKLGLRRDVYEQQRRADEIGSSEQKSRVLSDVGRSFYSALGAQAIVNLRKNLVSLALDAVTTAHQLANVGQADAPDVLQAEVEAEQAGVDYTTAQREFIQSFRTVAAVAGEPELELRPLAGDLEHPPQIDAEQVVDQIVRESPSIKRAQQEVLHAQAGLKSAKRESIPDLQIRAGLEQNFESNNQTTGTPVGLQGFATAAVNLPIFNRNQGNVAAAKAEVERAEAEVNRTQLSLRRSAQSVLQSFLSSQVQVERYRNEMLPRAARAYQLYLTKYQSMGAAYPQVLIAQRTYFQLQVSYNEALENLWMDAISMQNFMLSAGLDAPMGTANRSTTINPPSLTGPAQ